AGPVSVLQTDEDRNGHARNCPESDRGPTHGRERAAHLLADLGHQRRRRRGGGCADRTDHLPRPQSRVHRGQSLRRRHPGRLRQHPGRHRGGHVARRHREPLGLLLQRRDQAGLDLHPAHPRPGRETDRALRHGARQEGVTAMSPRSLQRCQGLCLVGGAVLLLALPNLADNYVRYVMTRLFIYILVALGLNLLTGYAGQVSLGHAAFFAIGAYTAAVLAESGRWPSALCLVAAAAFTGVIGYLL